MGLISVGSDSVCHCLNRKQLMTLKTKAIRSGVWFKALQRIDRVLIDLTIRVADTIRSPRLIKSILELTRKVNSVEKKSSLNLYKIGLPLAERQSLTAQKLGNKSAKSWASDTSFALFLAVLHVNCWKNITAT